jgi:hypothetical protein
MRDGDLVEEVEEDPDAFERTRWSRSETDRQIIRENWYSTRIANLREGSYRGVESVFMEDVRLHSREGRLVDPLDGSVENAAVENYEASRDRFRRRFDQLMTATTVLMNGYIIDISDDWMEIPFREYASNHQFYKRVNTRYEEMRRQEIVFEEDLTS